MRLVKLRARFNEMTDGLFQYVESLYRPDDEYPYALQAGLKGSVYGSVFCALILRLVGRIDAFQRQGDFIEALDALYDDKEGRYTHPRASGSGLLPGSAHSWEYIDLQTTAFIHSFLHAIGETPPPVKWARRVVSTGGNLSEWLSGLDWSNPWLVSNLDMFMGIFLLEEVDHGDGRSEAALEEYFNWHDENQDRATGFWGSTKDKLNAMAGAYHILLLYDYHGRSIQRVEPLIEETLQLAWRDGLFVYGGGGGSCEDMDAIDILVRLSLRTSHLLDRTRETLHTAAAALTDGMNRDGGYSWRIVPRPRWVGTSVRYRRPDLFLGRAAAALHGLRSRSHFHSVHYYSSLEQYPYKLSVSDAWSSWFRPLSIAFIAHGFPEFFSETCPWELPEWPGLGCGPFGTKRGSEVGATGSGAVDIRPTAP